MQKQVQSSRFDQYHTLECLTEIPPEPGEFFKSYEAYVFERLNMRENPA